MNELPVAMTAAVSGAALAPITIRLVAATRISARPTTSPETVAVTVLVGLLVAVSGSPGFVPLIVLGVAAAVVDLDERRLPNPLTGTLAMGAALIAIGAGTTAVGPAIEASTCILAVALLAKSINTDVLGWGDVKLLPSLAASLSTLHPHGLFVGLVCAMALLAITVVLFTATREQRYGDPVPYGPALVVGAFAAPLVA
ncbi:prepilin peptidase [Pseudonocardia sp. DLS-67]